MLKTIIVITQNPIDIINIPNNEEFKLFFIFVGNRPSIEELNYISEKDNYLILENAIQLGNKFMEIAIRAGILLSSQFNEFLFCFSNNFPNINNIKQTFNELNNKIEIITTDQCIGVSKEFLLFYGFDDLYKYVNKIQLPDDIIDLAEAMNGKPSSCETTITAIKEFVDFTDVFVVSEIPGKIGEKITENIINYNIEIPKTIIFSDNINKDELKEATQRIPSDGAVILITNEPEKYENPFQLLKINTGENILIYTKLND